jgi:hypothetical protein
VLCPVSLHNTSADTIDFQNFSIHVEHLRVYRGKHRLWSSEVRVYYRGVLQPPVIDYSKKPAYEEECELVSKERVAIDRSILRKYLSFIKKVSKSD